MDANVSAVLNAIDTIYSASTSNERRVEASQFIETLKDASPDEVQQLAFQLVSHENVMVSHVGWNFLEHIIKFKWLELSAEARVALRNGCFTHIALNKMSEPQLRSASSRCVVAMMEHEWPQNWPELFDQLHDLASVSVYHAQMPFTIVQRLVENVVTMVTVESAQRRKELNTSLATEIPRVIAMALATLERAAPASGEEWLSLERSALCLLGEIAEWLPAKSLEPRIDDILRVVCSFLNVPHFSICEQAAKCLWRFASRRRAKSDESSVVLALFGDVTMRSLLSSASTAASVGADDVDHYRYLKALCDVLSALGLHLADVWQKAPSNFGMFLAAIEAFLLHPSMYLRNEAAAVFAAFAGHAKISEDALFNESMYRVLPSLPRLLQKEGQPSLGDLSPCGLYSLIDFDDDADFMHCFIQFRDRCMRILRGACVERHVDSLCSIVEEWIIERCISATESVPEVEWDAMQRFSRAVLSECFSENLFDEQRIEVFTNLFDGVLSCVSGCTSALLINYLLSVLSSLFIILASNPDRLPPLLILIRRLLVENYDDSTDEKSMKRHCIAVLLRLTTVFSDAVRDQAESILEVCMSVRGSLSPMQQAACGQVLSALSNLCVDFATQSSFLACAMQETVTYFSMPEVKSAMEGDSTFLSFIGFSSPAPSNNEEAQRSPFIFNRRILRSNLSTVEGMLAQVRSISPPFHPAFQVIRPILSTLFAFAERVNSLYEPHCLSLIHPSYGPSVVDITAADRQQLLFAIDPVATSSTARILSDDACSHARSFVSDVTDSVQSITGYLGSAMAVELFAEPQVNCWSLLLASHVASAPDFRLRFWIRRSWRPFLCSCPEGAFLHVRELLRAVLSELQSRLSTRWEEIAQVEKSEEPSQDQLFAEHMACILTREAVTFLRSLLGITDSSSSSPEEKKEEVTCYITPHLNRDKAVFDSLVALVFLCLTCPDATASVRIIPACRVVVDMVGGRCDESVAVFMLVRSIQSLQIHGSDEVALGPLLSLVFHVYYSLRDGCESLVRVLAQVPQCSDDALRLFDNRIMSMRANKENVLEKMKREITKKLLRPVIATSVGEQHRRPVRLRPLPPLAKRAKPLVEEDFTALALIFGTAQ